VSRPTAPVLRHGLKPYPAYKDSGVEWLGEIPAHWDVKRLKHLSTTNPESLGEDANPTLEVLYVDIGGVDSRGRIIEREPLTFAAAPSRARRIVRDGDVIVSTVRTYLRAIAPVRAPEPGLIVSTGFAVVRPKDELTTDFAAYALRAPYFVDRVVANSTGVSFPAISEREIATYELALPPEREQRRIAAFLDRETARIDALVAKKEWLIELLQEKRTVLITSAVTKGLDPTVPMKDSGVEWLGEIPAHWEVKRLKYVADVNPPPLAALRLAQDAEASFVPMDAVGEYGGLDLTRTTPLANVGLGYTCFGEGDVIVAKITPCFENGKGALAVGLVNGVAFGTTELHVLRARVGLERTYLFYMTLSDAFRRLGEAEMYGAGGQKRVPKAFVENLKHAMPSRSEQRAIAAFLDRETAKLDALVTKVREAIERLQELRTALIAAAVTGKIDVREEVAARCASR